MASEVSICNRALQKLGAARITSLTDNSVNARACNNAYFDVRDATLRSHTWAFSVKRAVLASSTTAPAHTFDYAYPLPSDCLRLLSPDLNDVDWQIEDNCILTNIEGCEIRYVSRVEDPNKMDSLFREVVASALAMEMCEELTQSSQKMQLLMERHKELLKEARRNNAFERRSEKPKEGSWITVRT